MRPIKYRAFHKELKIMREVCTLRLDFNEVIVKFEKEGWTDKTTWFEGQFELMQFTGLHDRNGKEIYEGDIVKLYHDKLGVYWDKDGHWSHCGLLDLSEVIGNIHENPELLETK